MSPIRVLLVEDEPAHATLVRRYLAAAADRDFHVEWVEALANGLERLDSGAFDVVLLDLGLPDSDPRTTLRRILDATDLPVVVLTTSENRDEAIAAVKAGAQDHLAKPRVNADVLARTLFYSIERKRAERELNRFNELLEQRVAERSAVAERRARMLRHLAVDLSQTERRERRRLAQLLHDDLQQLIVAARMRLEMLRSTLSEDRHGEIVDQTIELLKRSIEVSRSLTLDLSPPVLHERGLGTALEWLGRRMEERYGLEVAVAVTGDPKKFDDDTASLLFEAARELLFNVVKHAGIARAEVALECEDPQRGRLIVRDRGKGFEPARIADQSGDRFGLFSIQERLQAVGGRFEAVSARSGGSTIRLVAPYACGTKAAQGGAAAHAGEGAGAGASERPRPDRTATAADEKTDATENDAR